MTSDERRAESHELRILTDVRLMIASVYRLSFPESEKWGVQNQIRRASVSVSLNLVEGNVFRGAKKCQFFDVALGSCCEVIECLKIREELFSTKTDEELLNLLDKIKRTIISLLVAHRPSSEVRA